MRAFVAILLLMVLSLPVMAQEIVVNPDPDPVSLSAGFWPNPYTVKFQNLERNIPAESIIAGCTGFVGAQPDVVIDWEGQGRPIQFAFQSDSDTALFVQGPDGHFYCVWDAFETPDPAVTIFGSMAGRYHVWIANDIAEPIDGGFFFLQFRNQR